MASTGGAGGNKNGVSGQVVCDGGQESSGGRIYVCGQWRSTTAMTTKAGDGGHGRGVVKRGCVSGWVRRGGRADWLVGSGIPGVNVEWKRGRRAEGAVRRGEATMSKIFTYQVCSF